MYLLICVLFLCNVNVLDNFVTGAVLRNELFPLDIIHYNDFHDRFEETSVLFPICKTNDSRCLGGFPRLYQEIMTLKKEKPDALLLNAGDTYQGTYWYTLLKWNVTQAFINLLPHDAHTIGNHEFDDGVAGLAPYLAKLDAPVVAANLNISKEPALKGLYKPHIVVERKGRKIGIIGLVTQDTTETSNPQGVIFLDPIKIVRKEAKLLTEQGIDIIIVLSHCGLRVDKEMAKLAGEDIDIIVGGHTHSLLWNGTSPSAERVDGPYPLMVEAQKRPGHEVMIVTASSSSKYLGNFTAYFDDEGDLQNIDATPIFLNRSIPEDLKIKAMLEPYKEKLNSLVHEPVGYSDIELLGDSCSMGECLLGDLAAEAFLSASREMYKTNLTSVAFLVRNIMKGAFPKGEITRGAVINVLPFSNKVVTFKLPGRHLVEAFEHCLKTFRVQKPFSGPFLVQVAGIKLTLNATSGRVLSAQVKNGEQLQEINPDEEYQITSVEFLRKGGNGFKMLRDNSRDVKDIGSDAQVLEQFIRNNSPLAPVLDNRLTIVG